MRHLCRQPRPLAALHRRSTFYESGLFDSTGRLVAVLSYDAKRTKRALLQALCQHGPDIADLARVDPDDCAVAWDSECHCWAIGDSGFAVRWTGFTEFERASETALAA